MPSFLWQDVYKPKRARFLLIPRMRCVWLRNNSNVTFGVIAESVNPNFHTEFNPKWPWTHTTSMRIPPYALWIISCSNLLHTHTKNDQQIVRMLVRCLHPQIVALTDCINIQGMPPWRKCVYNLGWGVDTHETLPHPLAPFTLQGSLNKTIHQAYCSNWILRRTGKLSLGAGSESTDISSVPKDRKSSQQSSHRYDDLSAGSFSTCFSFFSLSPTIVIYSRIKLPTIFLS